MSGMPAQVPVDALLDLAARVYHRLPLNAAVPELPMLRMQLEDHIGAYKLAEMLAAAYQQGRADEAATWGPGQQLWSVRFDDDGTVASPGAFNGEKGARAFAEYQPGRTTVTQRVWHRESGWEPA